MLAFASPRDGWLFASHGTSTDLDVTVGYRTRDGGARWEPQVEMVGLVATGIALWDESAGLVVLRTNEKGIGKQFLAKWDDEEVWFGGKRHVLFRTEDGGVRWQRGQSLDRFMEPRVLPCGQALLAGEFGRVLRSSDHGRTWHRVTTRFRRDISSLSSVGGSVVLVGSAGLAAYSEDSGQTWSELCHDLRHTFLDDVSLLTSSSGILVRPGAVYRFRLE